MCCISEVVRSVTFAAITVNNLISKIDNHQWIIWIMIIIIIYKMIMDFIISSSLLSMNPQSLLYHWRECCDYNCYHQYWIFFSSFPILRAYYDYSPFGSTEVRCILKYISECTVTRIKLCIDQNATYYIFDFLRFFKTPRLEMQSFKNCFCKTDL